ncbi:MAG TPA: hypothetical protein GX002_01770 [Clostridiales bacterium]|jgi:hypothetical protein|nr:hypothetical protein [Clostridiales bacterium]
MDISGGRLQYSIRNRITGKWVMKGYSFIVTWSPNNCQQATWMRHNNRKKTAIAFSLSLVLLTPAKRRDTAKPNINTIQERNNIITDPDKVYPPLI